MVVQNYAKELIARKEQCYVITPNNPDYADAKHPFRTIQFKGFQLKPSPQYRVGVPFLDFAYLRKIDRVKLDLIHAHTPFSAGMEAMRLKRSHKIPLIGTFHSKYYDDFYQVTRSDMISQMGVKLILNFYNACHQVWTVTEASKAVLQEYGYKGEIHVVPNGTSTWETELADPDLAETVYQLDPNKQMILFVGQQNWKKNIRHSMEALALYRRHRDNFQMVMVGQGPNELEIKELVEQLGLWKHVIFTGQVMDRVHLMSLYARADLFLFPSLYDTSGLVVREAASVGTPSMVCRNTCAAEGIEDRFNGFLCEDSPRDIANRLLWILADPDLLHRTGQKAQETIPISWSKVMDDVIYRYRQVIAEFGSKKRNIRKKESNA